MPVQSVFLSSVVTGFEDVRDGAAQGVRNAGLHASRSEEHPAAAEPPRRALLDEVGNADIYLVLLGERYGDFPSGERSPTEDEYEEAKRLGKPILVVNQRIEMERAQAEFLGRVRGDWGEGALSGSFTDANDVAAAVSAALTRHLAGVAEDAPSAQAAAAELARGEERRGHMSSGVAARVGVVPLRQTTLLDALALEDAGLGDDLAAAFRAAGLASQEVGIKASVSGAGVQLEGSTSQNWTAPEGLIRTDGALVVVGSVAGEGSFGGSAVSPTRLEDLVSAAGRFAQLAWDRVDSRREITRAAVCIAIPDASYKGFADSTGSSMSHSMRVPALVLAPDPAQVATRGELDQPALARALVAAVKRVFADAGAVQ